MAKSNPLFVDSTLLRGDSIGTQIELHNVLLFDGEAIYLVLLTENDEEICMPLTPTSETAFEVFVRLIHQRPVKFYFGIAKDGELLHRSEDYARIALYALIEEWNPVPVYQASLKTRAPAGTLVEEPQALLTPDLPVPPAETISPTGTTKQSLPLFGMNGAAQPATPVLLADEVMNITSLLQKWGFS